MKSLSMFCLTLLTGLVFTPRLGADESPTVLIVVGPSRHPPGSHEVAAGGRLMKHCIKQLQNLPGVRADVVKGWPEPSRQATAATIVFIGDTFPANRLRIASII